LLSPWLRRQRFRRALPYIHGRVLDVGCGVGLLAAHVEPGRYLGVDRDPDALRAARAAFPGHRFVADLPVAGRFDTIVALAVLEHLPEPEAALVSWARLLAPGGRIVLTTPHPRFVWLHELGAAAGVFSHDAAQEHHRFFDRASLQRAADAAGLGLLKVERFLGGANQLFVLAGGGSDARSA
jgi:SAM-dependent methyltransferase